MLRRLRYLLHLRREARDLTEEMEAHRAMAEDRERAAGLSEEEAHYAARRLLGNATQSREDSGHVWLAAWIGSVFQDLRYAARSLRSQPGFTSLALLALILGIGLNTSLFTIFNAVAVRPWPVRDPGRVVTLLSSAPKSRQYGGFSVAAYRYLNEHSHTLAGAVIERPQGVTLDQADPISAHFVSGNYFSVLGVEMTLGRGFTNDEDTVDGPQAVAVLSHGAWQTRYGADPNILGRRILLDDVPFTVIGIADQDFTGTAQGRYDLWAPLASLTVARPNDSSVRAWLTNPGYCCSQMSARLAPGVSRELATAELNTLIRQFQSDLAEQPREITLAGTTFLGRPDAKERAIPVMLLLAAAVGAILLLACANVSNLLLARAAARRREIAVRVAIGAGRGRIVRQLLTESLLLAATASGFGLLLAYMLPDFVLRHMVQDPPNVRLTPDTTVLAYAVGIAVFTAIVFGLAPALRGTRVTISDAMKQQNGHASARFPLRGALLGVQVTISVTLLVGAGLLIRGLWNARTLDPGFRTAGVTNVTVNLPVNSYDAARSRIFFDDLLTQMSSLTNDPVGIAAFPPLSNGRYMTGFTLPGWDPKRNDQVLVQWVNAGYFDALHIPIVAGRNFIPEDRERRNIVINETMARHYWPGQNPVGQAILVRPDRREIVGIVRDSQVYGLGPVEPVFFEPFAGGPHAVLPSSSAVLVVSSTEANAASEAVRRSESRAVVTTESLSAQLDRWLTSTRAGAQLAAALGLLALLLATVGVYGVIAYSVEQRRREIGVRMALGARPSEIVGLILKKNSRAILCGLVIGLALSLAASKLLESSLFGVSRLDPLAYGGVLALLLLAGVTASVIPSRRAVRTDPVRVLHYE
jgi:predicted permease